MPPRPQRRMIPALAFALAVVVTPAAHAGLSSEEMTITAAVTRGRPVALGLLEKLVNVNSGTMNFRGVREVGAILSTDFPLAQGTILMLATGFIVINLGVDVLYAYLDPRIARR